MDPTSFVTLLLEKTVQQERTLSLEGKKTRLGPEKEEGGNIHLQDYLRNFIPRTQANAIEAIREGAHVQTLLGQQHGGCWLFILCLSIIHSI
jgi:hypothetical protein